MLGENSNHNRGCETNGVEGAFKRSKKESIKRALAFGDLGLTGEDHGNIGSTPDQRLKENPGKIIWELLTDEEIIKTLDEEKEVIRTFWKILKANPDDQAALAIIEIAPKVFQQHIACLESIDRVPEKYRKPQP